MGISDLRHNLNQTPMQELGVSKYKRPSTNAGGDCWSSHKVSKCIKCKNKSADCLPFFRSRFLNTRIMARRSSSLPLALALLGSASPRKQGLAAFNILECSSTLLASIFGNLVIILVECLPGLLELTLHAQQLLHTTQFIRVTAQGKSEIVNFDFLAACVVSNLRSAMAKLKDKVCHNFIKYANCLGKGL